MEMKPSSGEAIAVRLDTALDGSEIAMDSIALARLIEEVRIQETGVDRSYNRTYNRHNR